MLYPAIEPYAQGLLDVGDGHHVYWEQCGAPHGLPVVFLHGGPGGGCSATSRRFFDPQRYRVVLFDQRGCGRSSPQANTHANSCAHLVQDLEHLRDHLAIEQWVVCGGSWGSTLAMAYTRRHRERVLGVVLRGVFAARQVELDWLYKPGGASQLFPQAWHEFANALGTHDPDQLLQAYDHALKSTDMQQAMHAAKAWCAWEDAISSVQTSSLALATSPAACLAMARISAHMFVHDPWLSDTDAEAIWPPRPMPPLPGILVQGQWDAVTPSTTAWELHQRWPGSMLRIVPEAGHSTSDSPLGQALVQALDDLADLCTPVSTQNL
jgi:proline iminopeptidase